MKISIAVVYFAVAAFSASAVAAHDGLSMVKNEEASGRKLLRAKPQGPKDNKQCKPDDNTFCPALFDPVCCTNNDGLLQQFSNSCEAVKVCATDCGMCPTEEQPEPIPFDPICFPNFDVVCTALFQPVCCDGVQFGNSCLADAWCGKNCMVGPCDGGNF